MSNSLHFFFTNKRIECVRHFCFKLKSVNWMTGNSLFYSILKNRRLCHKLQRERERELLVADLFFLGSSETRTSYNDDSPLIFEIHNHHILRPCERWEFIFKKIIHFPISFEFSVSAFPFSRVKDKRLWHTVIYLFKK